MDRPLLDPMAFVVDVDNVDEDGLPIEESIILLTKRLSQSLFNVLLEVEDVVVEVVIVVVPVELVVSLPPMLLSWLMGNCDEDVDDSKVGITSTGSPVSIPSTCILTASSMFQLHASKVTLARFSAAPEVEKNKPKKKD